MLYRRLDGLVSLAGVNQIFAAVRQQVLLVRRAVVDRSADLACVDVEPVLTLFGETETTIEV